jgi:hypothetical protein
MKKHFPLFITLVGAFSLGLFFLNKGKDPSKQEITVYHSKNCSCCEKWTEHLKKNGFTVNSIPVDDMQKVKMANNIPYSLSSCHTALVDGYIVEGHVPARAIQELLIKKPEGIKGIAVPGMPVGSPGMEGSYKEKYDVLTFGPTEKPKVFMSF